MDRSKDSSKDRFDIIWHNPAGLTALIIIFVMLATLCAILVVSSCTRMYTFGFTPEAKGIARHTETPPGPYDHNFTAQPSIHHIDSWCNLDALSPQNTRVLSPDPPTALSTIDTVLASPSAGWHPPRTSRLVWSFSPESTQRHATSPARFGLSSDSGLAEEQTMAEARGSPAAPRTKVRRAPRSFLVQTGR